jgi:hypothetical protein
MRTLYLLLLAIPPLLIAFGGAIVVPPDLTKIPGMTIIISNPTEVPQEVVEELIAMGIDEDKILLRDTNEEEE